MKVKIEKLDHFGRGITYINGKICFVENTLKDEVVEIKIIKETKKYFLATPTNYIEKSPRRIKENCPYSKVCGGCTFQHLSFEEENNFKQEKVKELVNKFTDLDQDLVDQITNTEPLQYRNKITLHGKNNQLGYYKSKTNELIPINKCLIVNNKINEILICLQNLAKHNNFKQVVIRTSNDEKKVMVKITGKVNEISKLQDKVDVLIINDKLITKEDKIISNIGSKNYFISIDSFFQVNKTLTEKLYDEVVTVVKNTKPQKVLDLYCGAGTIGIYISDIVEEIIGVDCCESSIKNANENKKLNNLQNITFICDKVENVIDDFNNIDLIIVDPPRAGLDSKTIKNITRINPKNLVYISCDPVTLVRDLKELSEKYEVKTIKPYNMFPRTYHVECVCVLNLRTPYKRKENNLSSR